MPNTLPIAASTDDRTEALRAKRLANLRPPWRPGISGNPSGRSKHNVDLQQLARDRTVDAIGTLINVMRNANAASAARVSAAIALLDRGWGRPTEALRLVDGQGQDRALVNSDFSQLEAARRIAFVLECGLKAQEKLEEGPHTPSALEFSQVPTEQKCADG